MNNSEIFFSEIRAPTWLLEFGKARMMTLTMEGRRPPMPWPLLMWPMYFSGKLARLAITLPEEV